MSSKRKKAFYKGAGAGKRFKGSELQQGAVGFLFSFTKDRERQAKAEAYELLNAYTKHLDVEDNGEKASSDEGSDEDIEAAMQAQLTKLKEKKKGDKFTYLVTGVNQTLFMKTSIPHHNNLTYKVLEDARNGELKSQSRALNRMVPVLSSCRAQLENIRDCVSAAVDVYLKSDGLNHPDEITYKSMVKVRNYSGKEFSQRTVISIIGECISDLYPQWRVNLSDPHICVVVDVLRSVCCVSVLHGYLQYKKFNLHELVANHHTHQAMKSADSRVGAGEKTGCSQSTSDGQFIAGEQLFEDGQSTGCEESTGGEQSTTGGPSTTDKQSTTDGVQSTTCGQSSTDGVQSTTGGQSSTDGVQSTTGGQSSTDGVQSTTGGQSAVDGQSSTDEQSTAGGQSTIAC